MTRFLTMLFIATAVLLLPTFLYISHTTPAYNLVEYEPGGYQGPLSNGGKLKQNANRLFHPPGQVSQGRPPAGGEGGAQETTKGKSTTLSNPFGENCLQNSKFKWLNFGACTKKHSGKGKKDQSTAKGAGSGAGTGAEELNLSSDAIMGKMDNATAKAQLGRATWHFLHTMTLRFPETPTKAQSEQLKDFITLFSHLYPCGECASHFQLLLQRYPPQVRSRKHASLWLCSVHNKVNERLGKPNFDCGKLDQTYDCGCGIDAIPVSNTGVATSTSDSTPSKATPVPGVPDGPKAASPSRRDVDWLDLAAYRDALAVARV